jgi:hypothetical protein
MASLIYISRNFTELGGFTSDEVEDFYKRGILRADDFVRPEEKEEWLLLHAWLSGATQTDSPIKTAEAASMPVISSQKQGKPKKRK